jgi:hypothetical protein
MNNEKEVVGLLLMMSAICLLGLQVYEYLRYSQWPSISIITAFEWMKIGWALNPTDWIGLHNILSKTALSLAMFAFGLIVLVS